MTKPQETYIIASITSFADTLTPEQLQTFLFRLDDLIQYGRGAVFVAYRTVELLNK